MGRLLKWGGAQTGNTNKYYTILVVFYKEFDMSQEYAPIEIITWKIYENTPLVHQTFKINLL